MIADAVEAIYNRAINAIAFYTRDMIFCPLSSRQKRAGKETIVVLAEESSAAAAEEYRRPRFNSWKKIGFTF